MWSLLCVVGLVICAFMAMRSQRLLVSALWLAGCSALVALLMYLMGAYQIAVIELSVGAGLVTVLFVFAINIAGEETPGLLALIPKPLAWSLVALAVVLLGWMTLPGFGAGIAVPLEGTFALAVWSERRLDVLLQIVLIFSGVLGILGLLAEGKPHAGKEHEA